MRCRGAFCLPFLLAVQKPQDLASSFQKVYEDLAVPSQICLQASPTIRFDKVFSNATTEHDNKPIAVFLPGLDGYGISAATHQFHDLSKTFQFWKLFVDPSDRSSFHQVTTTVSDFLIELHTNTSQPITLIGESCGGLFAAAVALKLRHSAVLQGLVVVNPATSFDRTAWDLVAPQLAMLDDLAVAPTKTDASPLPSPYAVLGSLVLSATVFDNQQFRSILDAILSVTDTTPQDLLETTLLAFQETEARLPAPLLKHRIQWLAVGASVVDARLAQIMVPTLVVVGQEDRLLPSKSEADRLVKTLPNAEKLTVRQRGHFVLDDKVNLTEAILYSLIDPLAWTQTKRKYDPITDWKLPDQATIDNVKESRLANLVAAHSPVWFSTDSQGKRWRGLHKLPGPFDPDYQRDGPILVVGNHQLAGLDLGLILTEVYSQCGFWPRGLAHPVTFFGSEDFPGELNGRKPGLMDGPAGSADMRPSFQLFGAVKVTPRNYYRLLKTGQPALLFPGGAKEAQSGRKDYPLFWPEKTDFVRTAARFNATILPLSAIGMVDSVNVLAEPQQIIDIPFLGSQLRSLNSNISSARFDAKKDDEVIGFPLVVPGLPERNYFLFGEPISLAGTDPNDKDACSAVYKKVQSEIRSGIDALLRAREYDGYRDTRKRLLYEQVYKKQAPTFPIDKLDT